MSACSGVVLSLITQSGLRSLGMGFAWGALAITLENLSPFALTPRKNEELWRKEYRGCKRVESMQGPRDAYEEPCINCTLGIQE